MKIMCKDCVHKSVCKHKYAYERTIESLDVKIEMPFDLHLHCTYYQPDIRDYYTVATNTQAGDTSYDVSDSFIDMSKRS
jgi:hypothetical protein